MTRITVIGGTGYAGSAIVREAAARGHHVTALSRTAPPDPIAGVEYVAGDATDRATLSPVISGAEVVVFALSPRGPMAERFREIARTVAGLADEAGARLFVVGGFSSLRPAAGADRFLSDLSHVPEAAHEEVRAGAALVMEDLPATGDTLDWVFVSPAQVFGAYAPREPIGSYLLGGEIAVVPDSGGVIAVEDYARGMLDLVERDDHHRAHVNLGNPA